MLLSACGPEVAREAYVQRKKVDVLYGDPAAEKKPAKRAPGANPVNVGFPGFVSPTPAIPRPLPPGSTPPPTIPPEEPPVLGPCPTAPVNATPATTAGGAVEGVPAPGSYTYRRSGDLHFEGMSHPVTGAVRRTITDVSQGGGSESVRKFAVEQVEGGVAVRQVGDGIRTRTEYEIDPTSPTRPGGAPATEEERFAGIKIVGITTEGPLGTDEFQPSSPVRFATLPFAPDSRRWGTGPDDVSERGVDPVHGFAMQVQHRTEGRSVVDVCGTLHQTWRVQVQGQFTGGVQTTYFRSVLDIAPQGGGLILRDELVLTDEVPSDPNGDGVWDFSRTGEFQLSTVSTITSVVPSS